ncbi:polyprotein P3 [Trichonephila clavipes]|nr:polyprotein P3 [Trichonephila clavipes]
MFSNNPDLTNLVEHEIQLVSDQPVRTKPYRMSHRQNEILKNEINRMLKLGIIEVGESDYMSPMILVEGYWQIPLSKTAQRYAAFCTSFGTYRPLRMSFGLKNAPYFFSKLMAELLNGLEDFVVPYLDDIAIFSDTWESHIKHMETVLQRMKRAKLTIKPSKFMTDHNPLVWLNRNVSSNPRLMRWALALQPYNFRIVHRSGKSHKNADSLSRSVIDN